MTNPGGGPTVSPMRTRFRIGRVLGFPVELHVTFLLLLGVAFVWLGGLLGVAVVLAAFASVLVHELGHAVVARALGVRVERIDLSFLGGAAQLGSLPRTATHELLIAAAGPAVSLVLAGLGLGLGAITGLYAVTLLGWINLGIGLFNLLPALPMDGGRILRAVLSRRRGYLGATHVAVRVARGFAIAIGIVGVATGSLQLVILAPFLWWLTGRELALARWTAPGYADGPSGYAARTPHVEHVGGDGLGPRPWGPLGSAVGRGPTRGARVIVFRRF